MRPGGLQQVGDDAVDARDFLANILHHRTRGAGCGQIAADDFDDPGNSGQRISNLVRQTGGHFAQSGHVLGARHLRAVQAFDLVAALAQLLDHVIEVAAQVSDLVVAMGKADGDAQVAAAELRNLLLQFDHRTLHRVGQHDQQRSADGDRACACD